MYKLIFTYKFRCYIILLSLFQIVIKKKFNKINCIYKIETMRYVISPWSVVQIINKIIDNFKRKPKIFMRKYTAVFFVSHSLDVMHINCSSYFFFTFSYTHWHEYRMDKWRCIVIVASKIKSSWAHSYSWGFEGFEKRPKRRFVAPEPIFWYRI